jgi:hypothetical protein
LGVSAGIIEFYLGRTAEAWQNTWMDVEERVEPALRRFNFLAGKSAGECGGKFQALHSSIPDTPLPEAEK